MKDKLFLKALYRVILTSKWYTPEAFLQVGKMNHKAVVASESFIEGMQKDLSTWEKFKLQILKTGGLPLLVVFIYGDMAALVTVASIFSEFFNLNYEVFFTALSVLRQAF